MLKMNIKRFKLLARIGIVYFTLILAGAYLSNGRYANTLVALSFIGGIFVMSIATMWFLYL